MKKNYSLIMSTSFIAIFIIIVSSVIPTFTTNIRVGTVKKEAENTFPDQGETANGGTEQTVDPNGEDEIVNHVEEAGPIEVIIFGESGDGGSEDCIEMISDAWNAAVEYAYSVEEIPEIKLDFSILDFSSILKLIASML